MTVSETLDLLRGRLSRLKAGRSYAQIAPQIGVNALSIQHFLYAKGGTTSTTLTKIETWCDREEQGHRD